MRNRKQPPASARLTPLLAIIESRTAELKSILVAGATASDDVARVIYELSVAFQDAGRRVAVLSLSTNSDAGVDIPRKSSLAECTREEFDSELRLLGTRVDVVLIEAPETLSAALGPHAARSSEAVVIALCEGRAVREEDHQLRSLLTQINSQVLGVVRTSRAGAPKTDRRASLARLLPNQIKPAL